MDASSRELNGQALPDLQVVSAVNMNSGKFDNGQCAICLEDPQVDKSFPPCGHVFCFKCLVEWCKTHERPQLQCPTCNEVFRKFIHHDGKAVYHASARHPRTRGKSVADALFFLNSAFYLGGYFSSNTNFGS